MVERDDPQAGGIGGGSTWGDTSDEDTGHEWHTSRWDQALARNLPSDLLSRLDIRGDIGADREVYERRLVAGSSYEQIMAAWARLDIDHPDYQIRPMPACRDRINI